MPAPVIVFEQNPAWREPLADKLGAAHQVDTATALNAVLPDGPAVVVLGPSCSKEPSLSGAVTIMQSRADTPGVLLADTPASDVMSAALAVGIRDIIPAAAHIEEIVATVERLADIRATRPDDDAKIEVETNVPAGAGHVTTVFSAKGGTGASLIATNLAVLLAAKHAKDVGDDDPSERPVVLVDLDLQFGDTAILLRQAPKETVADATKLVGSNDPALIQNILAVHETTGLRHLPAPHDVNTSVDLDRRDVLDVVRQLRASSTHVVVDTPSRLDGHTLSTFGISDHIVLVAGVDMMSMKAAAASLHALRMLNVDPARVHLVLNAPNAKTRFDVGSIERSLRVKVAAVLPYDPTVLDSVNTGEPIAATAPKSKFVRALGSITDLMDD